MFHSWIRTILPVALASALLCSVLFFPHVALAQDESPAYCAELSSEDCDLLTYSQEAMTALTAATTDVDFELTVSDIPELPFESLSIEYTQSSSYAISEAGVAARTALQQQLQDNAAALFVEPETLFQSYIDLLDGMTADVTMNLTLSDDIIMLIQAGMEAEGQPVFDIPGALQMRFRLVDEAYYINLSDLADFVPGISATGDMWIGFDWATFMQMALAEAEFDTMTPAEAELFGQMVAGSNNNLLTGPLVTTLSSTPVTVGALSYLQLERLADSEMDGADVAQFRTTVDYQALLADPMAQALLAELLRDESLINQELSEEEIGQMIQLIQFAGPPVLQSLGLEATETIALETGYLISSEVRMNWDLSQLLALATSFGGDDLGIEEVPVVAWSAVKTNSNFDEAVEVDVPETSLLFSFEELMSFTEFE